MTLKGIPQQKYKLAEYLAAFFLPALLILSVFAVFGIYPFGEKSLLVVDMNSEYIDYFAGLNGIVRSGGSFLRSWNMGMGLDMLGLIAFYAASPFNLIILLAPVEALTEAVFLITVLKIGACGLFFFIYARKVFGLPWLWVLIFSTAYALIGYNISFSSNIMWLDGVAFLPLAALGVEDIARSGKLKLFILSLIYIFFSSYYIGYMVGVFCFLYLTALCIRDRDSLAVYAKKLGLMICGAVIAAGCCAFLLLPAFLNLKNGQNGMWDIPISFGLRGGISEMFSKLMPGVYDSLTDSGRPNIYFTVFGAVMAVVFFINKSISRREKLVFGIFAAFLLLSMSCEIIDLGWHAFEDPTWFPARYSFTFSFLGLYLGLRCAEKHSGTNGMSFLAAAVIICVIFAEIATKSYAYIEWINVCLGLFLAAACAILARHLLGKKKRGIAAALLALVCAELWYNSYAIITGIDEQFYYKTRDSYYSYRHTYNPALSMLPENGQGAYRTELAELRNANGGLALGYNSISHYSTTTNQRLNTLLKALGYNYGTINELRFSPGSPFAAGLLGIKYVLSKGTLNGGYEAYDALGSVNIYENNLAFPLAFFGDNADFSGTGANPFVLQNNWAFSLWDNRYTAPYEYIPDAERSLFNLSHEDRDTGQQYFYRTTSDFGAHLEWTIENPDGRECYAYFSLYRGRFSRVKAYVNGEQSARILAYRSNAVIPLGNEKEIKLKLELEGENVSYQDVLFYSLNMDAARNISGRANAWKMDITHFDDTEVEGGITAPRDGFILTTFPYDEGWQVEVNGIGVDYEKFAGVFIAIPVKEGENAVIMRYQARGFGAGIAISILSAVAAVIVFILERRKPA